jgi:hypothetical protein
VLPDPDVVKSDALVNRGRVEQDVALNRILDRTTEHFAVRNIAITAADHRADALDAEAQIGAGAFDLNAIRFVHEFLERLHARLQFAVVECADIEIEVFESFRAHAGQLRHRGAGPSQHHPFCFPDSLVVHGTHFLRHQLHLLRWNVR